jgi:hypothetical protein
VKSVHHHSLNSAVFQIPKVPSGTKVGKLILLPAITKNFFIIVSHYPALPIILQGGIIDAGYVKIYP